MTATKLSARAWEILLTIDERCGPNGTYWLPGDRLGGTADWCERLGYHVNINGSGDARIVKSLRTKGLIKQVTSTQHSVEEYASRITEDGRLLIEQSLETGSIPLALKD